MKAILINPLFDHVIKRKEGFSFQYNKIVHPLELGYIATLLRNEGISPQIIDANALSIPSTSENWRKLKADVFVIVTASIDNWQCPFYEFEVIKEIKNTLPKNAQVIITGPHGTANAEEIIKMFGNDIIVVRGEPEFTVFNLIKSLKEKKDYSKMDGITFIKKGKLIHNKPAAMFDINLLPMPAYDLMPMDKYHYEIMGDKFCLMESSRGCPFKCNFCLKNMYRDVYKNRDPKKVVAEMKYVRDNYGVKNIFFIDLEFTIRKWDTLALCKEIVAADLGMRFAIQARADKVDDETLMWLKKAGCVLIHFGVESGDPDILKYTNKMITLEQIEDGVKRTKKAGIETLCFFIFGHEPETREQILKTISFAKKLNPDYASFVVLIPYAGTVIHKPSEGKPFFYTGGSKALSLEELEELRKKAIREFYLRPRYVVGKLKQIRGIDDIKVLWRGFNDLFLPLALGR